MTPRLSIVIPAYNIARFLKRGIGSLLSQTCRDFEIIIVDDGSTDGVTPAACDKAAALDQRISVVHTTNGGPGPARNAGIDAACGEYVGFFDIDDLARPDMVEKCLGYLDSAGSGVDMLVFGYREISAACRPADFSFDRISCMSNDEIRSAFVDHLMGLKIPNGFVWNKVYRRKFLTDNNLRFTDDAIQQDEIFNLACYGVAGSLMAVPDILYDYFVYESGNNRSHYIASRLEIYRHVRNAFRSLASHWSLDDRRIGAYVDRRFMLGVITCLDTNIGHPESPLGKEEQRLAADAIFRDGDVRDAALSLRRSGSAQLDIVGRTYLAAITRHSHTLRRVARLISQARELRRSARLFFTRHA